MAAAQTTKQREQVEAQLQSLEDNAQRLAEERRQLKKQLAILAEHERQERIVRYGELVCHAGLDGTEPATLLGALSQLAEQLKDATAAAKYARQGAPLLEKLQKPKKGQKPPAVASSTEPTEPAVDEP